MAPERNILISAHPEDSFNWADASVVGVVPAWIHNLLSSGDSNGRHSHSARIDDHSSGISFLLGTGDDDGSIFLWKHSTQTLDEELSPEHLRIKLTHPEHGNNKDGDGRSDLLVACIGDAKEGFNERVYAASPATGVLCVWILDDASNTKYRGFASVQLEMNPGELLTELIVLEYDEKNAWLLASTSHGRLWKVYYEPGFGAGLYPKLIERKLIAKSCRSSAEEGWGEGAIQDVFEKEDIVALASLPTTSSHNSSCANVVSVNSALMLKEWNISLLKVPGSEEGCTSKLQLFQRCTDGMLDLTSLKSRSVSGGVEDGLEGYHHAEMLSKPSLSKDGKSLLVVIRITKENDSKATRVYAVRIGLGHDVNLPSVMDATWLDGYSGNSLSKVECAGLVATELESDDESTLGSFAGAVLAYVAFGPCRGQSGQVTISAIIFPSANDAGQCAGPPRIKNLVLDSNMVPSVVRESLSYNPLTRGCVFLSSVGFLCSAHVDVRGVCVSGEEEVVGTNSSSQHPAGSPTSTELKLAQEKLEFAEFKLQWATNEVEGDKLEYERIKAALELSESKKEEFQDEVKMAKQKLKSLQSKKAAGSEPSMEDEKKEASEPGSNFGSQKLEDEKKNGFGFGAGSGFSEPSSVEEKEVPSKTKDVPSAFGFGAQKLENDSSAPSIPDASAAAAPDAAVLAFAFPTAGDEKKEGPSYTSAPVMSPAPTPKPAFAFGSVPESLADDEKKEEPDYTAAHATTPKTATDQYQDEVKLGEEQPGTLQSKKAPAAPTTAVSPFASGGKSPTGDEKKEDPSYTSSRAMSPAGSVLESLTDDEKKEEPDYTAARATTPKTATDKEKQYQDEVKMGEEQLGTLQSKKANDVFASATTTIKRPGISFGSLEPSNEDENQANAAVASAHSGAPKPENDSSAPSVPGAGAAAAPTTAAPFASGGKSPTGYKKNEDPSYTSACAMSPAPTPEPAAKPANKSTLPPLKKINLEEPPKDSTPETGGPKKRTKPGTPDSDLNTSTYSPIASPESAACFDWASFREVYCPAPGPKTCLDAIAKPPPDLYFNYVQWADIDLAKSIIIYVNIQHGFHKFTLIIPDDEDIRFVRNAIQQQTCIELEFWNTFDLFYGDEKLGDYDKTLLDYRIQTWSTVQAISKVAVRLAPKKLNL